MRRNSQRRPNAWTGYPDSWNGEQLPTRTTPLNREIIVDAAYDLIDAQGLSSFSMHALAKKLGVTAMALYRHVQDKDDLLESVQQRHWSEYDEREIPGERWDDTIRRTAMSVFCVDAAHPHMLALQYLKPALRRFEVMNKLHQRQGIPQEALHAIGVVADAYLAGFESYLKYMTNEEGCSFETGQRSGNSSDPLSVLKENFSEGLEVILVGIRAKHPGICDNWRTPDEPTNPA